MCSEQCSIVASKMPSISILDDALLSRATFLAFSVAVDVNYLIAASLMTSSRAENEAIKIFSRFAFR